jgi:hypothetical protein
MVKLLEKAERWQAMLDRGEVGNRAALARREVTSTNRVFQVLRLLQLPHDVLSVLRNLPAGTPVRFVTERALRRVACASELDEVRRRCLTLGASGGPDQP